MNKVKLSLGFQLKFEFMSKLKPGTWHSAWHSLQCGNKRSFSKSTPSFTQIKDFDDYLFFIYELFARVRLILQQESNL